MRYPQTTIIDVLHSQRTYLEKGRCRLSISQSNLLFRAPAGLVLTTAESREVNLVFVPILVGLLTRQHATGHKGHLKKGKSETRLKDVANAGIFQAPILNWDAGIIEVKQHCSAMIGDKAAFIVEIRKLRQW